MVIAWLAARVRNKLSGPRALCARAVGGLLDDRQIAEDDTDQRIEALIQAIAGSVAAIGGEAGHDAKRQPPAPDPHPAAVPLPAGDEAEAGPAPPPPGGLDQRRANRRKDLASGSPGAPCTPFPAQL